MTKPIAILLSIFILVSVAIAADAQSGAPQKIGFKILYNFTDGPDGCCLFGGVARDREGNLYGVTESNNHDHGYGTLYKLTPTKRGYSIHVLVDFDESKGTYCEGTPVVDDSGNVFGTCSRGGPDWGTLWEYSSGGKFQVLFHFSEYPGNLTLDQRGNIYGTSGGVYQGAGTLWKYAPRSHWMRVVHSFNYKTDGMDPGNPTIDHNGILWGTTMYGPNCWQCGQGTAWKYDPSSGTFTTVATFQGTGISNPVTRPAIDKNGNLFGTAWPTDGSNLGTIYELQADDSYAPLLLYTFTDQQNGSQPLTDLSFDKDGNLIGTTYLGGEYGDGTIYELAYKDGVWQETVLHSFDWTDGASPNGLVTDNKCKWFSTTTYGGKHGWGEVFEVTSLP